MEYSSPPNKHMEMSRYKQFFNINEQDTLDLIDPYYKALAYHSIGNYIQSNRYMNLVDNRKEHYQFATLEYLEYIHFLNKFFLDNRIIDFNLSKLSSEKYRQQAHEIINLEDLSKLIFNFVILVRKKNNNHLINDYLSRNPNLSGSLYLRYLYYFYSTFSGRMDTCCFGFYYFQPPFYGRIESCP